MAYAYAAGAKAGMKVLHGGAILNSFEKCINSVARFHWTAKHYGVIIAARIDVLCIDRSQ